MKSTQRNAPRRGWTLRGKASAILTLGSSFSLFVLLFGLAAVLAQTGCVGATAAKTTTSNANSNSNSSASAPSISGQPASQTVAAGQAATFTVSASATAPLTFQWSKNGAPISGAMASSYTTPATVTTDNGAQFTVTVTDGTGNTISNGATLTVTAATPGVLTSNLSTLNFANVNVGGNSTLQATLTNSGSTSVVISNVSVSGAGFTASGLPAGTILGAGQVATLNVTFGPSATGNATGSVVVASNATNSSDSISLSGSGVQAGQHSVSLTWTESTAGVAGYNEYQSTVSGASYTKLNSSLNSSESYTDTTVQAGQTYYYVVTSVNSSGVESGYSNQISAVIPAQ